MEEKQTTEEQLDTYAILDLFGHTRVAGRVRNAQIAGAGMIRIEVLDSEGNEAQTEYYSPQAVYSLKPVTKELAVAAARQLDNSPVEPYSLQRAIAKMDDHDIGSLNRMLKARRKLLKAADDEQEPDEIEGNEDETPFD